jgi:hypothetical protein
MALTDVGAYGANSDSFYGTNDQGGNVWEWNDAVVSGSTRGLRGSSWRNGDANMASSNPLYHAPSLEDRHLGFRVASVPEPAAEMLAFGLPGNPAVISGASISLTVPYGTNVTALAPTFTLSSEATCDRVSGTAYDFANPVMYTVRSSDALTTKIYTVTVTMTTPSIVVEQPSDNVLTSGTSTVNFGSGLTGVGVPLTFTIRNTGSAPLTGIAVAKDGANGDDFAITTAPATTVAAGGSSSLVVTFTPAASGAREAVLHISSNDPINPFNIRLTGTGIAPVPPTFTSAAPPATGRIGAGYHHVCTANGTTPITFAVTAGSLPPGLTITAGVIAGTPTETGTFSGTLTASNCVPPAATQDFSISIVEAPVFTSTAPPADGKVGTPYNHSSTASGFPAPTFSATGLPAGLTLTAAGVISGTPTAWGTFTGTLTAANGVLPNATQNFSITIVQAPVFTSAAPPPTGKVGTAYQHVCRADGTTPITFAVTAGALPSGLSMNEAGEIAGTPSEEGTFTGTLTATNGTAPAATQDFSITITQTPVLTLEFEDDTVIEGDSLAGQLMIDPVRSTPLLVTLASSRPTQLSAGPPLTIPAGQSSVPVTITGTQDSVIEAATDVRISASAPGVTAAEAVVTLLDDDWPTLTLALDRTAVAESAGPNAVIVTITRNPVSSQPLTVWLTNSAPAVAMLPETVTIPAGSNSISFPIGVVDNTTADGPRTVLLRAEVRLPGAGVISSSPQVSLEVGDDESARLEFVCERAWVLEGASVPVTVRRLGGSNADALTVHLAATPGDKLGIAATVEIPAGAAAADFTVAGVVNATADGQVRVRLAGTADSYSPGQIEMLVTDQPLPDLVPKNGLAPVSVATEASFQVSYRIENQGAAVTTQPFAQRVLLSKDPVVGDDVQLSQHVGYDLAAGAGFDRTENVRAPREAGTYWLLLVTDATRTVEEMVETNNTVLFATPLTVTAAYAAMVQTEAEQVPANTPIVLTGSATSDGGTKVPNVMVNIHLRVAGTERIISAMTSATGDFTTTWQPLPGEGGDYEIGASHPGVSTAPTQDSFAILTAKAEFPTGTLVFDEGASASITGDLTNPTAYELTGLALVAVNAPAGLGVQVTLPGTTLNPGATLQAGVTLTGAAGFHGRRTIILRLTTDQGVTLDVSVPVSVRQLLPLLVATPGSLKASVLRGEQKTVSFSVANRGGAATGPINLLLPDLAWLQLASPATLESLPPGGSATVTLRLAPGSAVPLTLYSGSLVIRPASGGGISLPFEFRMVSARTGDLQVETVDEAYYFSVGAPKLQGATVTLRDAISAEQIGSAETPANGRAAFTAIPEGWYKLEVTCPSHTRWQGNVFVNAGESNFRQVFTSLEAVSYTWKVEQVQLEDHYRVSVQTTFETSVPTPVVTMTPAVLDVEDLTLLGQSEVINFTIDNHGLIAADHGNFTFDSHPFYEITPLIANVGLIPAKSSITIPVSVRRIGEFAEDGTIRTFGANHRRVPKDAATQVPCGFQGRLAWDFLCGVIPVAKWTLIPASGVQGDCKDVPIRFQLNFPRPFSLDPVGTTDPSDPGHVPPEPDPSVDRVLIVSSFDGCGTLQCLVEALLSDCGSLTLPNGVGCTRKFFLATSGADFAKAVIECICDRAKLLLASPLPPAKSGAVGPIVACGLYKVFKCLPKILECNKIFQSEFQGPGDLGIIQFIPEDALAAADGLDTNYGASARRMATLGDAYVYVLGSREAALLFASDETWAVKEQYLKAVIGENDEQARISPDERAAIIQAATDSNMDPASLDTMIDRWNLTIDLRSQGAINYSDAPAGQRDNFIAADVFSLLSQRVVEAYEASEAAGFDSPEADFSYNLQRVRSVLQAKGEGVCSTVKIQLDQQAVMTRSAFRGTLELANNKADGSLTQVGFDLDIRDADGNDAREFFNIQVTKLTGLAAIDGTGQIGPKSAGSAQWTLIPRDTAAPLTDTTYTIGGTIRYDQGGTLFSIPVTAVPITVKPDAALYLKYFHQRDVYADDPDTDPVEPSIPYALAVMVENRGAGAAHNLRVTSAQPEIVDNEKGLLIDFQIMGTKVAGQNLTPSLTANFGEVPPGQRKVGTWWMTSSLQGLFTDYDATFEHLDGFGDARLSLIKDIEIHEMTRMIEALGPLADGVPDFLVNDMPDINDFPDRVHLSDGTTAPVAVYQIATLSGTPSPGSPSVALTASLGTGWAYLRIPDPANGTMRLTGVQRSDGLQIPLDKNVWTTDRTFIGLGNPPIRENLLHLADFDSTGSYTLTYTPLPGTDTTPPSSRVAALLPQSGVEIPVTWSGTDDQGVASYDIFVQIDTGDWQPWLEASTRTSSIYQGEAGHTYAFYSLASDRTGNAEVKAAAADTATQVSLANVAPVITPIPEQVIPEGSTLVYQVLASDPDAPSGALSYAVSSSVPGVVINTSGRLSWVTSEADGGSEVDVVVTVTDSGSPAASAQVGVHLSVLEMNSPPLVQSVVPQYVEVGKTLTLTLSANDRDFPEQTLTYAFAGNVPAGMTLHPATGLITWTPAKSDSARSHPVTVTVTDSGVPAASGQVSFAVSVPGLPATIVTHPVPVIIDSGDSVTLNVSATGTDPLTYQWYQGTSGNTAVPVGNNSPSFTTPALTATTSYWVKVTNAANPAGANSNTATVALKTVVGVTLGSLTQVYDGSIKAAVATTDVAGLTVNFSYNGNASAPVNAGSYEVIATVVDPAYAGRATGTLVISKAPQVITFAPIADQTIDTPVLDLEASSSSMRIVQFSVVAGPASVSGSKITLSGLGEVVVQADQPGDENWLAAAPVQIAFRVVAGNFAQDYVWAKGFGGTGYDTAYAVATDPTGQAYLLGDFAGAVTFGASNIAAAGGAASDLMLMKMNADGGIAWTRQYGGVYADYAKTVVALPSGGVVAGGEFYTSTTLSGNTLTAAGSKDILLVKVDANGTTQWAKRFGGTASDSLHAMAVDASGNLYLAGQFNGTINLGSATLTSSGASDGFIAKLDSTGTVIWARKMGGTSANIAYSVAVKSTGELAVAGSFSGVAKVGSIALTSDGGSDAFVTLLDSAGAFQWAKRFGGNTADHARATAFDAAGNLWACGSFTGSGATGFGVAPLASAGAEDIFIVRLTPADGTLLEATRYGGTGTDTALSLVTDPFGTMMLAGAFQNSIALGSSTLVSSGLSDTFVAKLRDGTGVVWALRGGGANDDRSQALAISTSGDIFHAGVFDTGATFGVHGVNGGGLGDLFIAKINGPMPSFTAGFSDHAVDEGDPWSLSTGTIGAVPVTFQWFKDDSPVEGATSNRYEVAAAALSDEGVYVLQATNAYGTATTMPITVTVAVRVPDQVLSVEPPLATSENRTIDAPIYLDSLGDVGSLSFVIPFNKNYLTKPSFLPAPELTDDHISVVVDENAGTVRIVVNAFLWTLPEGRQLLGTLQLVTRSVPVGTSVKLTPTLLRISDVFDRPLGGYTRLSSGTVAIAQRGIPGDANNNGRLDISDAAELIRLCANPSLIRTWDQSLNDLTGDALLTDGDVNRTLRAITEIANPPVFPIGTPPGPHARLVLSRLSGIDANKVLAEVYLDGVTDGQAGLSFRVNYPASILRITDASSLTIPPGGLPAATVPQWNVAPGNNFADQTGSVAFAAAWDSSHPFTSGQAVANILFELHAGNISQVHFPLELTAVEVAPYHAGGPSSPLAVSGQVVTFSRTYGEWALATLGHADADPNADADADGERNGREFAASTHPADAQSRLQTTAMGLNPEGFTLSWVAAYGVRYCVRWSDDLLQWNDLTMAPFLGLGAEVEITDPSPHGEKRFYRVEVMPDP